MDVVPPVAVVSPTQPLEGSGLRTHRAVPHSKLVTVPGAPHGLNTSHPRQFNDALLAFLREG